MFYLYSNIHRIDIKSVFDFVRNGWPMVYKTKYLDLQCLQIICLNTNVLNSKLERWREVLKENRLR